jgi:hypothetical protein
MKTLELIILLVWIVGIIVVQFHEPTMSVINKYDYLSFFPGFFLFSPRPFYGFYKIRYEITDINNGVSIITHSDVNYILPRDLIDTNQKVIKCVNELCKSSLFKPMPSNIHFNLLVNYILNDARKKSYSGKLRFYIIVATNLTESIHFKSIYYDL